MRPFVLSESNLKVVSENNYTTAILPWGSLEAHNYHLPYGTDSFQSIYICEAAAKKAWEEGAGVFVLPAITYGVNTGQLDIKLTINMNPSTQLAVLNDIATSLIKHNIQKLVIINGHGGNDLKSQIRELQFLYPDFFIGLINWYKVLDDKAYFDDPGEHGGEMETSNMLSIRPDLVAPLDSAGDGESRKINVYGFADGWAWSPRVWTKATNDTGIGNPHSATVEKGEKFLEEMITEISKSLVDLAQADINDIYA